MKYRVKVVFQLILFILLHNSVNHVPRGNETDCYVLLNLFPV